MEETDLQDILDRRRAGATLQAIATDYGLSRERIRQICKKHGVAPEKNWEGLPNSGEHRTVGSHRAWCYDDVEWCYPGTLCKCCDQQTVPISWRGDYAGWVLSELKIAVLAMQERSEHPEVLTEVLTLLEKGPQRVES